MIPSQVELVIFGSNLAATDNPQRGALNVAWTLQQTFGLGLSAAERRKSRKHPIAIGLAKGDRSVRGQLALRVHDSQCFGADGGLMAIHDPSGRVPLFKRTVVA
jgi:hypothetical protein